MNTVTYRNFDLQFSPSNAGYRARIRSPQGETVRAFSLPDVDARFEQFLCDIGRPRRALTFGVPDETGSRSPPRSTRRFGGLLFQSVFQGEVLGLLRVSVAAAREAEDRLRIRLDFSEVPELARLPWEYLYDKMFDTYLALSQDTPLVRYIGRPTKPQPLQVDRPLRILTVISGPPAYPPLAVEREWAKMGNALQEVIDAGYVELTRVEPPTLDALEDTLRRGHYHVLHFIGHGDFDRRQGSGLLLFERSDGSGHRVSAQHVGTLLSNHRPLRLVLLNACNGAAAAEADSFTGTAQTLIRKGVPAVLAMQFELTDSAAIAFARKFYTAIADFVPVDAALTSARLALSWDHELEWGTPVLFMRTTDGQLFTEAQSPDRSAADQNKRPSVPAETDEAVEPNSPPEAGGPTFNTGDIQAAVVNQGGTQHFGDLSINLDFADTSSPSDGDEDSGDARPPAGDTQAASEEDGIAAHFRRARQSLAAHRDVFSPNHTQQLRDLVTQLETAIVRLPSSTAPTDREVATRLVKLIDEVCTEHPDAEMVAIMGESAKRSAAKLQDVAPNVPTLMSRIVTQVERVVQ